MRETDGDPRNPSRRNGRRRMSALPFRASASMAAVDRRNDSIDAIRTVVQLTNQACRMARIARIDAPGALHHVIIRFDLIEEESLRT
jgi:hypothetical protein